jgi:hypothetical protein
VLQRADGQQDRTVVEEQERVWLPGRVELGSLGVWLV